MKEKSLIRTLKYLKILLKIKQNPTIEKLKSFVESYYEIPNMSQEFYELLLQQLDSKRIIKIIMQGNIYALISNMKNNGEDVEEIERYLTAEDYFQIPKKRINKIINLLQQLPQNKNILNELTKEDLQWKLRRRPTYQLKEYQEIAYKLYTCLGYENIIELLKQKYGNINYEQIYYLANNLENKILPKEEKEFIQNYLFGSKNDFNNPIRQMLSGRFIELFINFDYFYNNLSFFIDKIGTKLKSDKLKILLKERFLTFNPTVPEITGELKDDIISSFYHKYMSEQTPEEEIIDLNIELYTSKLRNKYMSSIPQIPLESTGEITPELLTLSNPRNLTHGYRSGNCFRPNGEAAILFSQFLESEHMRILSFSTPEYKDYAMVLLMRNGNTLIAQGIETSRWIPKELKGINLYNLTKSALKQIMDYMNLEGDEIVATIIGMTNENVSSYNNQILPFLVNPILENGNNYYNGISSYQCLLDTAQNKTIYDIKLYSPKHRYFDERENILVKSSNDFNPNIEKRIIALRYQRTKTNDGFSFYQQIGSHHELQTICNKDWYITEFTDGTVDSFISDTKDPRAKEEFQKELEKVYQKKK